MLRIFLWTYFKWYTGEHTHPQFSLHSCHASTSFIAKLPQLIYFALSLVIKFYFNNISFFVYYFFTVTKLVLCKKFKLTTALPSNFFGLTSR